MNRNLKEIITADAYRMLCKKKISFIDLIKLKLSKTSFRYLVTFRKAHYYLHENYKIRYVFYRYRLLHLSIKYGYQINVKAEIDKGLYLGHRGSIIINGDCRIGKNVNLANGVTIGAEVRGDRKGVPTIGNKVWIGANVTIVGKITIEDNVLIAPNTFVNFNIPSNSIVLGRNSIISSLDATKEYVQNIILK